MNNRPMRPGAAWYLLPLFIFLITVILVPVAMIAFAAHNNPVAFQLLVPGDKDFEIHKPGKYVLWDEVQTVFDGKTFSSSNQLPTGVRIGSLGAQLPPGIQIRLYNLATSNQIPMTSSMNSRVSIGRTVRLSVGNFEITSPGKYRLSVLGQFPQRVFYFRNSMLDGVLLTLCAVGIGAMGILISVVLAIIMFFKRRASRA